MKPALPLLATLTLALGCSGGGTSPNSGNDDGVRLGAQFDHLADSVAAGGYSPAADALRHAGEIARLTGHATPVTLTIDGSSRSFLAVAEQIDFPNLVCSWPDSGFVPPPDSVPGSPPDTLVVPPPDTLVVPPPDTLVVPPPDTLVVPPPDTLVVPPPDSVPTPPNGGGGGVVPPDTIHIPVDSGVVGPPPECKPQGTYSMRTLIAWEPEHMKEVVRIVAYIGSSGVEPGVPDVMNGLPSGKLGSSPAASPPDSGGGSGGEPGGFPGFMGEYLVRNVGSWFATAGNQSNDIVKSGGDCTAPSATLDWAQFDCAAARYRFEFSMGVEPLRYGPLTGSTDSLGGGGPGPQGNHQLAMTSTEIDGVRLTWTAWTMPPFPPDSGIVAYGGRGSD